MSAAFTAIVSHYTVRRQLTALLLCNVNLLYYAQKTGDLEPNLWCHVLLILGSD
jgi:hypothetical protein